MSQLSEQFEAAAASVQQLHSRPDNATLLKLYALYKQATAGDVTGKRPGMLDMAGRAKYDAWEKCKGTSQDSAMEAYVELVNELESR